MPRSCRSCRYSSPPDIPPDEVSGFCRIKPPKIVDTAGNVSAYPPVHLDRFTCGEHRRRPLWRRLFGWIA